jgi:hypothetical protein
MVHVDTLAEVNNIKGYRISPGDKLRIPLKKERLSPVLVKPITFDKQSIDSILATSSFIQKKEQYNITLLLPFKIDDNGQVLEELDDQNTRLNKVTDIALDFYLGIKLALDSLEKMGLNAKINVFDTQGNVEVLESILNKSELLQADVIIGPFFPKTIEKAADWARKNQKQLYVPVGLNTEVLKNNPFVISSVPSELTLYAGMASYIVDHYSGAKIILIEGNNIIERDRIDFFKTQLTSYAASRGKTIAYSMTALGSGTGRDLARKFELDSLNIFISLSTDPQYVMRFINTLNAAKNQTTSHSETPLIVFGSKEWLDMNSLTSYYKNRFNLHVPLSSYVDYNRPEVLKFVDKVQSELNLDPSRFLFQGFDLTYYIGNTVLMGAVSEPGFMNDFNFYQLGIRHGLENQTAFIAVQRNFELKIESIVKNKVVLEETSAIEVKELDNEKDINNEGGN